MFVYFSLEIATDLLGVLVAYLVTRFNTKSTYRNNIDKTHTTNGFDFRIFNQDLFLVLYLITPKYKS